jgi:hypothetical protein
MSEVYYELCSYRVCILSAFLKKLVAGPEAETPAETPAEAAE